jgi:hypothetical protein
MRAPALHLAAALVFVAALACAPERTTRSLKDDVDPAVTAAQQAAAETASTSSSSSGAVAVTPRESVAPDATGSADGAAAREGEVSAIQMRMYNRLLGKALDGATLDTAQLEADIAACSGGTVAKIRKGPMGLLSIELEATDPPRDEAAQREVVRACQKVPQVKYLEPEQLMQAKGRNASGSP